MRLLNEQRESYVKLKRDPSSFTVKELLREEAYYVPTTTTTYGTETLLKLSERETELRFVSRNFY